MIERDDRRDEAALAPFFAAARERPVAPPTPLLNAVIADAADVTEARRRPPAVVRPRAGLGALLDPLGGWPGLAALGACAALGLWLGLAGGARLEAALFPTAEADPIAEFYDLAAAES